MGRYVSLLVLLCVILLSGCKTKYFPIEKTVYRESVKYDTLHTSDSILIHDSISVFLKGDTVYKDKWHKEKELKTVYKTKVDSILKIDSIPAPYPVEKELTKWEQFQLKYSIWAFGALCMVLLYLSYKLYRRIKNECSSYNNREK